MATGISCAVARRLRTTSGRKPELGNKKGAASEWVGAALVHSDLISISSILGVSALFSSLYRRIRKNQALRDRFDQLAERKWSRD